MMVWRGAREVPDDGDTVSAYADIARARRAPVPS